MAREEKLRLYTTTHLIFLPLGEENTRPSGVTFTQGDTTTACFFSSCVAAAIAPLPKPQTMLTCWGAGFHHFFTAHKKAVCRVSPCQRLFFKSPTPGDVWRAAPFHCEGVFLCGWFVSANYSNDNSGWDLLWQKLHLFATEFHCLSAESE